VKQQVCTKGKHWTRCENPQNGRRRIGPIRPSLQSQPTDDTTEIGTPRHFRHCSESVRCRGSCRPAQQSVFTPAIEPLQSSAPFSAQQPSDLSTCIALALRRNGCGLVSDPLRTPFALGEAATSPLAAAKQRCGLMLR